MPALIIALASCFPDIGFTAAEGTLIVGLLVATITDIGSCKIFNWTTYPLIAWAIVFSAAVSLLTLGGYEVVWLGEQGLVGAVFGMMCCGAITLVAYFGSGGGAGDVKLALMVGGLLGPESGVLVVAVAYILAALSALVASFADASTVGLLSGLARKIGCQLSPWVPPPSTRHSLLLQRKTPLAAYFAIAGWFMVSMP